MNKAILNEIFRTALIGANPKKCISESIGLENNHIKIENDTYDLNKINRIFIISFGKSSIPMSEAISKILKNKIYHLSYEFFLIDEKFLELMVLSTQFYENVFECCF